MEQYNRVPKNIARRLILTRLLDLAPAALGVDVLEQTVRTLEAFVTPAIKTGPIDLVEHRSALTSYQNAINGEGYSWLVAASDILARIQALHNQAWYAGAQKIEMVQLLCGFHLVLAEIGSEQRLQNTIESFNNAIILAREYKLPQHYAYALNRRGLFLEQSNNSEAASRDYHQAQRVKNLPPCLQGQIITSASVVDARCAQYPEEIMEALKRIDDAEPLIESNAEEEVYLIKFDRDRWLLNRAAVRVGSPLRECRFPNKALEDLEQVAFSDESRRSAYREIFSSTLQAKAYIDLENQAFATQLAKDATKIMREIQCYSRGVHDIETLYVALKASNYGNSKAVIELSVDLLKMQHPELFPLD